MTLPQGTLLARYQVLGLIGAGGMGEVYRARDTHLQREVALKVLPQGFSEEAAADARFEREARAIASLSHPNICAVYDAGVTDGKRFLIMELLQGQTLQEALRRGPLDVADVVVHAIAISDALHTAHSRDVIHRDLKPANIFLTSGGQVKVLDFGLAKTVGPPDDTTSAADELITAEGSTIGTAAYMSPEQLRGEALDARTDLFSFGLVLFEMATGRQPFSASTGAAVAARILTDDPPRPSDVRSGLPAELERTILKALEKDRDLRYQTAADVRADLRRLQRRDSPLGQQARGRRKGVLFLGVAVLLAVIVSLLTVIRRDPPRTTPILQVQPLTLEGQTRLGAISPDGRFLVYQHYDDQSIRARQISSNTEIPLVPAGRFTRVSSLTISPDGNFVDVVALSGSAQIPDVWRLPLLGGAPRQVLRGVVSAIGWSPDGATMAFVSYRDRGDSTLVLADASGSHLRELVTRRAPHMFYGDLTDRVGRPQSRPSFSPDGKRIALMGYSTDTFGEASEALIFDVSTGAAEPPRRLRGIWKEVSWLEGDRLLLIGGTGPGPEASKIWLGDLELQHLTLVTQEFGIFENLSVTRDRKTAVAKRFTRVSGIWVGTGSGGDARIAVPPSAAGAGQPTVDGNGGLTFTASKPDGVFAVYHLAPGTSTPVQVVDRTLPPFAGRYYDVSSDGGTIVFSQVEAPGGLFRVQTDGTAPVRLIDGDTREPRLTPDGRTILFARGTPGVFAVPAAGGPVRQLTDRVVPSVQNAGRKSLMSVSLDGTRLLLATERPGIVALCDLPDCTNVQELSLPSADWAPSSKGVAYVEGETRLMEQPLAGGEPRVIARLDGSDPIINFRWSPDGLHLATSRGRYPNDLVIIRGLPSGN